MRRLAPPLDEVADRRQRARRERWYRNEVGDRAGDFAPWRSSANRYLAELPHVEWSISR